MSGARGAAATALTLVLACLSGGCEFPECGSESDANNYPGGVCMQGAGQSVAGARAEAASTNPAASPQQALIGFRARPQYPGIVPAWLFTNTLGTFDIDAMVTGRPPSDQWRWTSDGDTAVYEQDGTLGQFQDVVQLFAPPRDQRFERSYELVGSDNSVQHMRFLRDGTLIVCDGPGLPRREHYAINGFAFDWTRADGSVERHALLYDPADASQMWLGSRLVVASNSDVCQP